MKRLLDILAWFATIIGGLASVLALVYLYKQSKAIGTNNLPQVCQSYDKLFDTYGNLLFNAFWIIVVLSIVNATITIISLKKESKYHKAEDEKNIAMKMFTQYNNLFTSVLGDFHNIIHYERDMRQLLSSPSSLSSDEIFTKYATFLSSTTQCIKNFIDKDEGINCAVTIKIINDSKEFTRTLFRDPVSNRTRCTNDYDSNGNISKSLISENSDFNNLIHSNKVNNRYFISNDIKNTIIGQYKNSNTEWDKLYNSVLVCPIEYRINDTYDVVGFLCIDSLSANFSKVSTINFIGGISDLLYGNIKDAINYSRSITSPSSNKLYSKITKWV